MGPEGMGIDEIAAVEGVESAFPQLEGFKFSCLVKFISCRKRWFKVI